MITFTQKRCDQNKNTWVWTRNWRFWPTNKEAISLFPSYAMHTLVLILSLCLWSNLCKCSLHVMSDTDGTKQRRFAANWRLILWKMENLVLRSRISRSSWLHVNQTGGVQRILHFHINRIVGAVTYFSRLCWQGMGLHTKNRSVYGLSHKHK